MWRIAFAVAAFLAGTVATAPVSADPNRLAKAPTPPSVMRVFGTAYPPFGFVQFCERMPVECQAGTIVEARIAATPDRLSELDQVNRAINRQIVPTTDLELYGTNEYWTIPSTHGDCEDYVLLKRRVLIERGWPPSALLITVVRDDQGEGHAVLTARTQHGDFILDNKTSDMKLWHQTGYRFVMRQSYINPKLWMSLEAGESSLAPLTGNRR